jgi:hypothetical protein
MFYTMFVALGWAAVSLLMAIIFSIWVKGKITLVLWVGLIIVVFVFGLTLLVIL